MNIPAKLAVRHMKLNKTRTVFSVLCTSFTVCIMIVVSAFLGTMLDLMERTKIISDVADVMEDNTEVSLTYASGAIYLMLACLSAIFIYHAFSNSASEQIRYLGLLASVGATKKQKRSCLFVEGALIGCGGVIIGFILGLILSQLCFQLGSEWLKAFTGSTLEPRFALSPQMTAAAVICALLSVFAACVLPMIRVSEISIIDAMRGKEKKMPDRKASCLPNWIKQHLSAEFQMAYKNITFHKRRYISIIFPLILSMCLFLVVYVYLQYLSGAYNLGKGRAYEENSLSVQIENATEEKMEELFQMIKSDTEVERTRYYKTITTAAGFPEDYVRKIDGAVPRFYYTVSKGSYYPAPMLNQSGNESNYYPFDIIFYGLDKEAYSEYLDRCGVSKNEISSNTAIIEDTVIYRLRGKDFLGGSLTLPVKDKAQLLLNSPWDEYFYISRDHDVQGQLLNFDNTVLTKLPPPINPSVKPGEYNWNQVSMYLPMEQFEKLMNTPAFLNMNNKESFFSVASVMEIEIKRPRTDSFLKSDFFHLASKKIIKQHAQEDSVYMRKLTETGSSIGLNIVPYISEWMLLERETEDPYPYMMQIFSYGILLLIAAFCLSNIVSGMSASMALRKREFPTLQSMGMTVGGIRKMLLIENSLYALMAVIIGIPTSILSIKLFTMHLRSKRGLNITVPAYIFYIEIIFIAAIILISMFSALRQYRKINIIEAIRSENI